MGRIRTVHRAAQVRDGDRVEERKVEKRAEVNKAESLWRQRGLQVHYGLCQQQGLAVWLGLFLQGCFAKTL